MQGQAAEGEHEMPDPQRHQAGRLQVWRRHWLQQEAGSEWGGTEELQEGDRGDEGKQALLLTMLLQVWSHDRYFLIILIN